MDRQSNRKTVGHRRGGVFSLLAWILLFVTVIGLILRIFSGTGVEGALAKTQKKLTARESDGLFLLSALSDGSLTLRGEGMELLWNASLAEEGYTLSAKEGGNRFALYAVGDNVTAAGSLFPDGTVFAPRRSAAYALAGSALDREGVAPEHYAFFQGLLSLADPDLGSFDVLSSSVERILKKAKPELLKEDGEYKDGKNRLDVVQYTYRFSSEALVRACGALLKEGQKEEVQRSVSAYYAAALSACGKKITAEDQKAVLSFLKGEGKAFDSFSNLLGKSDSSLEITLSVYDGAVVAGQVQWSLGDLRQKAELFLGADPETAVRSFLRVSADRGEENLFSLNVTDEILDDSESAYIREWKWSLSHQGGFFSEEQKSTEGTLRYSWGKAKGDLGLKWMEGEESLVLRGTLLSRKEEKEIKIRLNRVEENGSNLLPCDFVDVVFNRTCAMEEPPAAKQSLFPEGEQKESFGQRFEEAYNTLFGGGQG